MVNESVDCLSAARCRLVAADLVSSGLVQGFVVPLLALLDLQSLENVNTNFRQLTDSMTQPEWRAVRARLVPCGHHLANMTTGQTTAALT